MAESQRTYQKFQYANAEIVLDAYVKNIIPNDPQNLLIAIEHTAYLFPAEFIKNVWGEMYSTGNISLISNDSLRQQLSSLYIFFDFVKNLQKEFNHFLYKYRDATASVVDPYSRKEINSKLHPTQLDEKLNPIEDIQPTLKRLKNIEKLDGDISNVIMKNEALMGIFEEIIRRIDRVISSVQNELNNS